MSRWRELVIHPARAYVIAVRERNFHALTRRRPLLARGTRPTRSWQEWPCLAFPNTHHARISTLTTPLSPGHLFARFPAPSLLFDPRR